MALSRGVRRLAFIACFIAGLLVAPLAIQLSNLPISRHQIQLVTSPDGHTDAVAMAVRTGIFTPLPGCKVYLVSHGATLRGAVPVFAATRVENVRLAWAMPRLLEISYARAEIRYFQNYWLPPGGGDKLAGIRLAPTSSTFSFLNAPGSIDAETD